MVRMMALARASADLEESLASAPPIPSSVAPPLPAREPPDNEVRFRVSIRRWGRDPTLLVVQRLDEGKPLPAGTSEGWLAMSESTDVDATRASK
jgi:hypothetical protein